MVPVDAQNLAIFRAFPPKWAKTCPRSGRTAMPNFTPIGKAAADKPATVQTEGEKKQ